MPGVQALVGFASSSPLLFASTGAVTLLTLVWIVRKMLPSSPMTRAVAQAQPAQGEGAIYRSVLSPTIMSTPHPDVRTLYELISYVAQQYPENLALGSRPLVRMHEESKDVETVVNGVTKVEKKKWSFYELGSYSWINYRQFAQRRLDIGAGLVALGAQPRKSMAGIFCNTRAEWMMFAHGCFTQSIPVATVYANLGEEGLVHAINEGKLEFLFTSADLLPTIAGILSKAASLRAVIYVDEPNDAGNKALASDAFKGVRAFSLTQVEKLGRDQPSQPRPPSPSDMAVIMYTSGSTGAPKGVIILHSNLVAAVAGAHAAMKHHINSRDIYLAYLPLAHVLELMVEHVIMFFGGALGYGSVRTLTDLSIRNCKNDLKELRPTLMAAVPTVWETIRKGALHKVESGSAVTRSIFRLAYKVKHAYMHAGLPGTLWGGGAVSPGFHFAALPLVGAALTGLFNVIVFKTFAGNLGGRMRLLVSGGAPLSVETHQFLRVCFGVPVIQGYGLTESCGMCSAQPTDHPGYAVAGAPIPCTEVKLVDVPEMNYTSQTSPPSGEIWIRGPSIAAGYYANEKLSAETFKNGWLLTGDIGTWNPDGTLSIIDRKKNLVKLSHGEYIALERLESVYKDSTFVANVCVYADGLRDFPIAIVFPALRQVQKWAQELKASGASSGGHMSQEEFAAACKTPALQKAVLDSLQEAGKKAKLKPIEQVQRVILTADEWTPENDMLTAAMKLKRASVIARFKQAISDAYGK